MASLAKCEGLRDKVQCIYINPPYGIKFDSNFQPSTNIRDVRDSKAEHITREPEQVKAFRDTWRDGIHSYLTYLRDRLTTSIPPAGLVQPLMLPSSGAAGGSPSTPAELPLRWRVRASWGRVGRGFLDHLANANNDANPELPRLALKLATGAGDMAGFVVLLLFIPFSSLEAIMIFYEMFKERERREGREEGLQEGREETRRELLQELTRVFAGDKDAMEKIDKFFNGTTATSQK